MKLFAATHTTNKRTGLDHDLEIHSASCRSRRNFYASAFGETEITHDYEADSLEQGVRDLMYSAFLPEDWQEGERFAQIMAGKDRLVHVHKCAHKAAAAEDAHYEETAR